MRVAYVCRVGGSTGWGHFGRGRALRDAGGTDVTLWVGGSPRGAIDELSQRVGFELAEWESEKVPFGAGSDHCDVVVVDDYALTQEWLDRSLTHRPTFLVDDWVRSNPRASGLINQNLDASPSDYPGASVGEWLLGPQHCLLRREVVEARRADTSQFVPMDAPRVLVSLGGSDPAEVTVDAVHALVKAAWYRDGGSIEVVLGSSYPRDEDEVRALLGNLERISTVRAPRDFISRCMRADLVVCGSGTTTYELALLRVPFLPIAIVPNQERVVRGWARRGVGGALNVNAPSWRAALTEGTNRMIGRSALVDAAIEAAAATVDGRGATRVLERLQRAK
jgi:spore coat polysaccharide biosynthesis predicted glycosyltransferase SpsG